MTEFARRQGRVTPGLGSSDASTAPRSLVGWLLRSLWRVGAAFAALLAVAAVSSGEWILFAVVATQALLIWPEVAAFARDRGLGLYRAGFAWVMILASVVLLGGGFGGAKPPAAPVAPVEPRQVAAQLTLTDYRTKVPSHAVLEIDRSDYYATVHRSLGTTRVRDANTLAPWAALRVAFSPRCDRVDLVEIAQDADKSELRWFVDCLNHQRFYVSEADASATRLKFRDVLATTRVTPTIEDLPRSENAKVEGFDEAAGLAGCEAGMRSLLQSTSSYRPSGAARILKHPQRGRVTISRDFTAVNGFGARLDSKWECLVDAGDMRIIEVKWLDGGQWRHTGP